MRASDRDELFWRRLTEAQAFGAASEQLSSSHPELSARWGLSAQQIAAALILSAGCGAWFYFAPAFAAHSLANLAAIAFALIIAFRLWSVFAAFRKRPPSPTRLLHNHQLPMLTVLVPLRGEARIMPNLIAAISGLDYPDWLLDVKLLIEADDPETIAAALAQPLPAHFEILPVPPGAPRTKPKALNYALDFARGEFIVVFDAEDIPSPEQPRTAVTAFAEGPANLAVVQAPLEIYNGRDSWISGQFGLEYAIHFGVWLPFISRRKFPVPLGGTSNYIRRRMLLEAGSWDAWNVTEDADIGLRLARLGYVTTMIAPPTLEEATVRRRAWMNQRTRWIKGHLQTWLVLNRDPLRTMREMGLVNYLSTHLTLGGGLLASLLHGPLYLWIAANIFIFQSVEAWHWILFVLGYGSAVGAALVSRSRLATPLMLATMPLYWPLQSWAMLRAIYEIIFKPHFWSKTQHGITAAQPQAGPLFPHRPASDDSVVQLHFEFFQPARGPGRRAL